MRAIVFLLCTCVSAQSICLNNPIRILEDDIANVVDYLQTKYVRQNAETSKILDLRNIRTNLIVNRVYHDKLNARELRNVFVCWRFAFDEILLHLNFHTKSAALPGLECFEEAKNNIVEITPKIDVNAVFGLVQKIEDAAADSARWPDVGEFVQAVDTMAHLVQTRFQHDRRHADQYAQSSTTLIMAIISRQRIDLKEAIAIFLAELRKIAGLLQAELKAYQQAHVELFLGGLSNVLNVFVARRSSARNTTALEFWRGVFRHSAESVFVGQEHVKQALAIQALDFKKRALELGYRAEYAHLSTLSRFARATTSEIRDEFVSHVLLATSTLQSEYLPLVQSFGVQMQNVFRLSHEENVQVLFLHVASTLRQMPDEGSRAIDSLQLLVIETYKRGRGIDSMTTFLRKLLIFLQRRLLNDYLQ